jgi:PAS domain S-box-containing protein
MWHSRQVGLCVIDLNNCLVTANPTLCEWLETSLENLQQQEFINFLQLNDDHKQVVLSMYQDVMQADAEIRPTVLTLLGAQQNTLDVWVQGEFLETEQGECHCALLLHQLRKFVGQEEIHYRSLIEHQRQFLVTRWRPKDLIFTFVNDAYAAFYGSKRETCIGQSIMTFIVPEARAPFLEKVAKAVQQGTTFTAEEYVRSAAGSWHWLRWVNEPILGSNGQVQLFQGMGVDVTEQVLRERALKLNDARYREISEISVESLFSYFYGPPQDSHSGSTEGQRLTSSKHADASTTITSAINSNYDTTHNPTDPVYIADSTWCWERDWEPEPSTRRLTGYSLAEIDALGGWPALVHPDDLEHFNDSRRNLVPNERREAEYRLITKAGNVIWIESLLHVTAAEDRPGLRVYGSDRDITEYKRVELALRRAVDEQDVMLKEIHHRVNNNMQVISSLLALQSHDIDNPQVKASLAESRARIMAMADVHKEIYESPRLAGIDFAEYLQHVVRRIKAAHAGRIITVDFKLTSILLGVEQAVPFGLIANELLQDVFKRAAQQDPTSDQSSVTISLHKLSEAEFAARQQAAGISSDLATLDLLAFVKARASSPQAQPEQQIMCLTISDTCGQVENGNESLAMTIVRALAEQLNAVLELSTSDNGVVMEVSCPVNETYTKTDTSPFWQTHAAERKDT